MTELRQALTDYLQLRRSLGHKMAVAGWLLPDFVGFLEQAGQSTVTIASALAWVKARETEVVTALSPRRITAVRGFARYLTGIDPATEVPPPGLVPHHARWREPFLYSETDIAAILHEARRIDPPVRAATYYTLIGLLAAAGVGSSATRPPRLHDLRHTFAIRTLLAWYRTGVNVQPKIPALSTYLGHREPASTYWYLAAAPELLALAAARREGIGKAARR